MKVKNLIEKVQRSDLAERFCFCCHEAGHSVARVLNGDALLLVVSDPRVEMTGEQRAFYEAGDRMKGERGRTMARCKERSCRCGRGTVRNRSNSLLSDFSLNLDCESCAEILIGELSCSFAGGMATLALVPEVHSDADITLDLAEISVVAKQLNLKGEKRESIVRRAKFRARNWVQQESRAVVGLAGTLFNSAVLDGKEAERIIRANLHQRAESRFGYGASLNLTL
jgi:hypothetical protein